MSSVSSVVLWRTVTSLSSVSLIWVPVSLAVVTRVAVSLAVVSLAVVSLGAGCLEVVLLAVG
jgi:hypothetical protein